jgi:putative methionine-R-sulfoxide reductase with GAF domain
MTDTSNQRDYARLHERAAAAMAGGLGAAGARARMSAMADLIWEELAPTGVSWCGFYLDADAAERVLGAESLGADDELILGPRRDKPACSPIGMHGACGQTYLAGRAMVVRDVRDLGENYVACDPRDLAEVVLPLFEPVDDDNNKESDGSPRPEPRHRCYGVLDLDSFDVGAFTDHDARELQRLLETFGLTVAQVRAPSACE